MSSPDYSDTTIYNVQGGTVPQYYPIGYPQRIDSDPLISNYILALKAKCASLSHSAILSQTFQVKISSFDSLY